MSAAEFWAMWWQAVVIIGTMFAVFGMVVGLVYLLIKKTQKG